jgi:hypothetical protein
MYRTERCGRGSADWDMIRLGAILLRGYDHFRCSPASPVFCIAAQHGARPLD